MKALPAPHVVAPAVLLNRSLALRAVLRVLVDPSEGLGVGVELLHPLLEELAVQGSMPLVGALEAEALSTVAVDLLAPSLIDAGHLAAVDARTPLHHTPLRLDELVGLGFPEGIDHVTCVGSQSLEARVVEGNLASSGGAGNFRNTETRLKQWDRNRE